MTKTKPRTVCGLPINSMQDLVVAGDLLAKTKIMGDINPADGFVIASICYQHGISYADFAETYNFMHGRLSKKADAILTDLCTLGGSYEILERTGDVAKAKFVFAENTKIFEVKFDLLKKEPYIYTGKESDVLKLIAANQTDKLVLKAKYATERSRMQMLWARCVSDGVRAVCPAACKGIYTPEEVSDFEDETTPTQTAIPSWANANAPTPSPNQSPCEVCPIGQFEGKKWQELETDILVMVEDLNDPAITAEMKQHVRDILAARKGSN